MEDKILKFATAVVVVLTVAVCIGLPFFHRSIPGQWNRGKSV